MAKEINTPTLAGFSGRTVRIRCKHYDQVIHWKLLGVDQGCLILSDGPSIGKVDNYILPLSSVESVEVLA